MGFDSFYNSEQQVTKSSGEWNRKMKTAIAILISSLSLGLFAYVQVEQEGEEPIPTLEELDEPLSDQTKQESPEAVAKQEEEGMEEEVNTNTSDENDKERGSFFDQFD